MKDSNGFLCVPSAWTWLRTDMTLMASPTSDSAIPTSIMMGVPKGTQCAIEHHPYRWIWYQSSSLNLCQGLRSLMRFPQPNYPPLEEKSTSDQVYSCRLVHETVEGRGEQVWLASFLLRPRQGGGGPHYCWFNYPLLRKTSLIRKSICQVRSCWTVRYTNVFIIFSQSIWTLTMYYLHI